MKDTGLVLEGGGMRGVYTAGVLDFFMDNNLYFPYVIGVSAGACNGCSYISKQRGRNKVININFVRDPKYLSYRNLIKSKSIFGMDYIFNEIPYKIIPFDFDTYFNSDTKFVIGATDCKTGNPVYFYKTPTHNVLKEVRASSSLPFVAPIINHKGFSLLDGGISDPIPVKKSIADGNSKNVIVLTRPDGYRKKPSKGKFLVKRVYSKYEGLVNAIFNRYNLYNETLDYIDTLSKDGTAFIIRPSKLIDVSRIEKDPKKLTKLYELGYDDAKSAYERLKVWFNS